MENRSGSRVKKLPALSTLVRPLLWEAWTEVLLTAMSALHAVWPANADKVVLAPFLRVAIEQE